VPWLRRLVTGFPPRRSGFEPGSGHVEFVVDKVELGQVFSEYFGFPCQFTFHRLFHNHHHPSSGACTIGRTVAASTKETQSHPMRKNTNNKKKTSLTRGRVCRLQLLLSIALLLGSDSRGTRDHILLSQIRDSPNLKGQVPVLISPRSSRMTQLYP
jgi:hypothetical protein